MCAIATCVATAVPATAQPLTGGPFTGLFRGSPKDQPHTLDIRASAFAAWDDNLLATLPAGASGGAGSAVDPRFIKSGIANGFQGAASYDFRKNGTRSQFNIGGNASVQEFASGLASSPLWFHSYSGSTGLRTSITNKTSLSIGARAAYAPFYQYAPFLKSTTSEESPVGSDYGFATQSAWVRSTSASATLENRFSKKSRISVGASWDGRVIPENDDANVDTRGVMALFSHSLTRKLSFRVAYGIQESRYAITPDAEPVRTNLLDVGLGFGDGITLSFGRHYTLSLSVGTSLAKNGDPVSVAATGKNTAFAVTGGATLSRSIGRMWATSLGYARGTFYVVGFREPMMTDSANAGVGGPLFSRLQFSAGAGASRGQRLFSSDSGGDIVSYSASTRLTYALFTHLGLYGQASYYRYSIPAGFTNFGFVPDLDRRSVSVGLTTWLPLIKQRRERRIPADQTTTGQP